MELKSTSHGSSRYAQCVSQQRVFILYDLWFVVLKMNILMNDMKSFEMHKRSFIPAFGLYAL